MFLFHRPGPDELAALIDSLRNAPVTSSSERGEVPPGFVLDEHRVVLGTGARTFEAARQSILNWAMFPEQMAPLFPSRAPIEPGTIVCVLFQSRPLWTVNPCRILQVIDNRTNDLIRFGFTYGALPGHVARGQETFLVEWNRAAGTVSYSIRVFSRPAHWLVWLGYPWARYQQRRFRRLSGESMQSSVQRLIET